MKVSFCITCKNRFHQISKTLFKNLNDNISIQDQIEFILVDFDSNDNLKEWVIQRFQSSLSSGYLKFFFTEGLPDWHCSIAKNTAHLLAQGEIVVNLDCDNFTGRNGARYVMKQFERYGPKLLLHQSSGAWSDGSFGRISMLKKYFQVIGGYNEAFNPMGYQDTDLLHRLIRMGLFYTPKCNSLYNKAISNTKEESVLYTNSSKLYQDMSYENMLLSAKNIENGNILANDGNMGIRKNILQYKDGQFIVLK